jgi:hypothetical protein
VAHKIGFDEGGAVLDFIGPGVHGLETNEVLREIHNLAHGTILSALTLR